MILKVWLVYQVREVEDPLLLGKYDDEYAHKLRLSGGILKDYGGSLELGKNGQSRF